MQYKIKGIAQTETLRHKRDLWTFIERSLRIKEGQFEAFCEDSVDMSRPRHVRGEIYIEIFDSVLTR